MARARYFQCARYGCARFTHDPSELCFKHRGPTAIHPVELSNRRARGKVAALVRFLRALAGMND